MRRFINLYIVLFLMDAGLSLADEVLSMLATPWPGLSGIRNLVALLVIVLSMLVYPLMGIDRRLPKRILVPLTAYIFWCSMALWPLQGMIARESFGAMAAFGQIFIGGVVLITLRSFYGPRLLPVDHFQGPLFGWRNTLFFTGVNLLLLPFLLVYVLLAMAGAYLDQATAGFMRLSPIGVYAADRSYHRGIKTVRLAAMMHFGRKEYYQELVDSLPTEKTIILAEGVTDQDGMLKHRLSYWSLAGLVGLSSQESMRLEGHPVELDELGSVAGPERADGRADILRADTDVSRFDPGTVEFLNVLGRTLLGNKPLAQGVTEYRAWVDTRQNSAWFADVMADVLDRRNAVLIDSFQRSLKRYDTIIIPWGALHMPAIEDAVLGQRFVPGAAREQLVVDFRTLPYATLWEKIVSMPEEDASPYAAD